MANILPDPWPLALRDEKLCLDFIWDPDDGMTPRAKCSTACTEACAFGETSGCESLSCCSSCYHEVATDRIFAAAENARFWPDALAAKKCIEQRGIGEVLGER